jgi:hypothetical protein
VACSDSKIISSIMNLIDTRYVFLNGGLPHHRVTQENVDIYPCPERDLNLDSRVRANTWIGWKMRIIFVRWVFSHTVYCSVHGHLNGITKILPLLVKLIFCVRFEVLKAASITRLKLGTYTVQVSCFRDFPHPPGEC